MTEEEAKRTRCCGPQGCGALRADKRTNATGQKVAITSRWCVGSACMAFRSAVTAHEILKVGEIPQREGLAKKGSPVRGKGARWQEWERIDSWCGLAGKP